MKERPQASCRDLLSRALKALRVNVFRLRPVANTSGGHEAFGYSVQGLHKPGRNEDRWGDWRHGPGSLLVVADGVSTADLGSGSMAAEEIVQLIDTTSFGAPMFANVVDRCVADGRGWPDRAREYLDELLRRAHARIVKRTNMLARERGGAVRPAKDPMSSTATVAFVLGDQAVIGWVGDSPAWIFSPDRGLFNRVTASQNVGREREFSFDATAGASALTQAVGGCDFSSAERKYVAAPLEPEFVTVQLAVGDVLILGSDGAVDGIGEAAPQDNEARFAAEVRRLCAEKKPLNRIVRDLIDPAESGAGHDNITLVVLRVTPGKEDHGRRDHSLLRAQP